MPHASRLDRPARARSAGQTGELALIERIRHRAVQIRATPELELGIGDDCAILHPQMGEELVVTTDFCLEDRHWTRAWNPPASVGHRTLARGLSDLAAMGARPVAAFLSLALPTETARDRGWVDEFLDGLHALASEHGMPLAGGDTSESPSAHVLADIVCLGAVPRGTALRRSGARAGDALYCTGTLGGSFAERSGLAEKVSKASVSSPAETSRTAGKHHPFLYPEPRLEIGLVLRMRGFATACMDLSDGLSTDLHHLCEASGVGAEVELSRLPASRWLRGLASEQRLDAMLHGGEDYELLFTAAPEVRMPRRVAGVPITRIGKMTRRPRSRSAVFTVGTDGRQPLLQRGWEHLR